MAGGHRFHRKLRKCNTCGREANACYTSCTKWCPKQKRNVYCGNMRVVR